MLCLSANMLHAQVTLPKAWKFSIGDKTEWANNAFDDKEWKTIQAGEMWESQGYANYDGYAWYRVHVTIPSALKAKADKYGGFVLSLGRIDDVDATYINGSLVGQSGKFPEAFETAYGVQRDYKIAASAIKWDADNVIAIRVYDYSGGGGLYTEAPSLRLKGVSDEVAIDPSFSSPDHVYLTPDVSFSLNIQNKSKESISGSILTSLKNDFGKDITSQAIEVKLSKGSNKVQTIKVKNLEPGVYKCVVQFTGEIVNKIVKFNIIVSPEKIACDTDRPADFQQYWDRARHELAAVDPQFKMIKQEKAVHPGKDLYLVEMRSLGNVLIRGWYEVPQKPGKYPVILQVQGYSTNQVPEWLEPYEGFACFVLNVRGHGNSKSNVNPGFPGYLQYQIQDKEQYIYRGAYMDCLRAIDFLFSRPEIDTTKLIVEGGSQGGALTFATASLAPDKVRAAVPMIPFLSDFPHYFKVAAWPANEFIGYAEANPDFGWKGIFNTLSYIDIKNLAPWVKCPVLMGVGLLDEVCPPHINFNAYNKLTVPREYRVCPNEGHSTDAAFNAYKYEWIKKQLSISTK